MGSFANTSYTQTISNTVQSYQDRLAKNPYYKFTDKKPTKVTYWNTNSTMSTYDQGTIQSYDHISEDDPNRFNQINGFYLYGISRMNVDIQIGELGPEASPIEGEAYVLPNTIIPLAGDYFMIDYLKDNPILFRVMASSPDTLETGANFYKISYKLDRVKASHYKQLITKQVIKKYNFIPTNVGTNWACILSEEDTTSLTVLSNLLNQLKEYYINAFYRKNIQTFVYPYDHGNFLIYDPYMIEFMIRNNLFTNYNGEYLFVSQATFRSSSFALEYMKTIFKNFEDSNPELVLNSAYAIPVCDTQSLLMYRLEEYYELSTLAQNIDRKNPINILDMKLFDRIVNNEPYDEEDITSPIYRNIIINYINDKSNTTISDAEIDSINKIQYARTKDLFYELPLLMYCIQGYIDQLASNSNNEDDGEVCPVCLMTNT